MQEWWYREFRRIIGAWVFVVVLLFLAALSVAAIDFTDYIFSHSTFCGNVCHVMESTVYQELQESKHWKTPTGVRATCANCHVDGRLTLAMVDHFLGTGDLFVNLTNPAPLTGNVSYSWKTTAKDAGVVTSWRR
jgi:nitrate/TMAO reductase-like tetraheme cytochrome c subunit